jgi:hypothetical protein
MRIHGFAMPTGAMLMVFLMLYPSYVRPQSQEKIYSALMLNFARGIQWPDARTSGSFVIGVLEYPPLAAELNATTASVKVGNRKIEVKEFARPEEVGECHMLFIPAYKARTLPDVLNKVGTQATLIITNKMDYAREGSGVNFLLVEGKLRYEINCRSIESRGMKISANVKGMGIIVE